MRIAKYLSSCGLGARRKCEKFILDGRVQINNVLIFDPSTNVDTDKDKVSLDNKLMKPQKNVYFLLNKPVGYTTTLADPHAKKIITELLPSKPLVWPVGRLDKNTSGIIIMTNDGELTQRLTHPKYKKEKEYLVNLDKPIQDTDINKIVKGVWLEDGLIKPDFLEKILEKKLRIVIHEGRKRIIRRLFEYLGYKVTALERIRISTIMIDNLKVGEYRKLTDVEVKELLDA